MKRADLIVRGGLLVLDDDLRRADLVVDVGKIATIMDPGDRSYSADNEIDVRGKHVLPGLVDAHVHFNDPGHAEREGYVTGTRAAAAGGVTTVIDMPLSCTPATTSLAALELKRAVAAEAAIVDYGHWGGLVTDNVEAMAALHEAGVLGFKAFMAETGVADYPRATDGVLLAGLHEAARLGTVVLVHAENEEIAQYYTTRLLAQGRRDPLAWAEGRPPVVEIEGIHCPQYLALCDEDLARIGVEAKCGPPLRSRATMEALWERVLAGRVDSIASDHSPSVTEDKTRYAHDVWAAWGGVPGLQTMLPVLLTEGVRRRGMPLPLLSRLTSTNPARQFGLYPRKGSLQPGADADLAIVDL